MQTEVSKQEEEAVCPSCHNTGYVAIRYGPEPLDFDIEACDTCDLFECGTVFLGETEVFS